MTQQTERRYAADQAAGTRCLMLAVVPLPVVPARPAGGRTPEGVFVFLVSFSFR